MGDRYEVRICGTGGQGVVLTGIIMAEAVGLWGAGRNVVQTVSYGPQVRGGLSSAELVISENEIDYPKPIKLDLLVPFTQEAANEGASILKPEGLILHDLELVHHAPKGWVVPIALTRLAVESTGRQQMANIVALGAMVGLNSWLAPEAMYAALKERAPSGLTEVFLKAATAGLESVRANREKIAFEDSPSPED
jgi:2-oxoglutarate ferredoxin oxidoreductase subunit gamma